MSEKLQKLELTWPGKDERFNPEPRILLEDTSKSYSKEPTEESSVKPTFDNMLIHGDNLLALKALEQDYTGKVKCIYIDPPYNTGNAFEHYDDGLEHSIWLSLMRDRLEILWKLLTPDGLMAIQIDDNEFARLFMLLCEICTQQNLKIICVKMSEATGVKMASVNKAGSIPKIKEFIILAKKDGIKNLKIDKIPKEKWDNEYKYLVKGVSKEDLDYIKSILENDDATDEEVKKGDEIANNITLGSITEIINSNNAEDIENIKYENAWRIVRDVAVTGNVKLLADEKRKYVEKGCFLIKTPQSKKYLMKKDYNSQSEQPRCKLLFADTYLTINPGDLWTDIKTTGLNNEGNVDFRNGKKPEKLIKRIIDMNTNPGDLVLDSFLGSGTTCAVAHKMGRRWIGVEMGDHVYSHCIPRLTKVINGEDQGGITKTTGWKNGGGFKFYELASSLIVKDRYGQQVISDKYNADMLAEAMCKILDYHYQPDKEKYWKQGFSSEKSFIYTTTMSMQETSLEALAEEVGDNNLLICCSAFRGNTNAYPNISVKKIPTAILKKCEWGATGYPFQLKDYQPKDEDFEFDEEE